MARHQPKIFVHCFLPFVLGALPATALGFVPEVRWGATASAPASTPGDPITLSWSIVPDGTIIQGEGASNLIHFLDDVFGAGPSGDDLTHRPWFSLLAAPFHRWSQLSGMTFIYEPLDDGVIHGSADGALEVRGDVRIGGAAADGPLGTLAYIYFPSNSDLVIDTADGAFFTNPALNHRQFRNALMHELGHGFGLAHVASSSDAFLMEPAINISFDGPQLDDIRGIQAYYGDALEKSHGGHGNNSIATATNLGVLTSGTTRSIGSDAAPDTVVAANDVDFVSIANNFDTDVFSFEVKWPVGLNAVLTPRGGVFNHGVQGGIQSLTNANADNDLRMTILASDGVTALAIADSVTAGIAETLAGVHLPAAGQYFVEVAGSSDVVQMYQLDLSLVSAATLLPGDFNRDGDINAADYVVWRKTLEQRGLGLAADANSDLVVDNADYQAWRRNYGLIAASTAHSPSVPEPTTCLSAIVGLISIAARRALRSQHL